VHARNKWVLLLFFRTLKGGEGKQGQDGSWRLRGRRCFASWGTGIPKERDSVSQRSYRREKKWKIMSPQGEVTRGTNVHFPLQHGEKEKPEKHSPQTS